MEGRDRRGQCWTTQDEFLRDSTEGRQVDTDAAPESIFGDAPTAWVKDPGTPVSAPTPTASLDTTTPTSGRAMDRVSSPQPSRLWRSSFGRRWPFAICCCGSDGRTFKAGQVNQRFLLGLKMAGPSMEACFEVDRLKGSNTLSSRRPSNICSYWRNIESYGRS